MNELSKQPLQSKRIELIIIPGRSLGPFRIGSSLWDIINFLSDKTQFFPSVELKYSQEEPLEYDLIVSLPANGLNLRFDGSLQRLKSIECYDPNKVKLVYQNNDVSSSRTIPTFLLIYKSFGPTYPGEFDSKQSIYTLKYPGLSFTFPIPMKHQNLYKSSVDLPLEFPDGTTPIASKIMLYSWQQDTPLSKIIAESNTKKGQKREIENAIVKPTIGITLLFPTYIVNTATDTNASDDISYQTISIGLNTTTVQDILADLGKPTRVFYKEEDKMKIHSVTNKHVSPSQDSNKSTPDSMREEDKSRDPLFIQPTDYFFNYFHLGIDILIDGGLHKCKKIILHGNIPGHYDFQRYKRCPFQIIFPKDKNKKPDNESLLVDIEEDNENIIMANMKIKAMQDLIPWDKSENQQKPVILTRGSSEQNPFGSTHLTGYDEGIAMEVMKNGYVPTIILF